jgi:hypothetical protein
MANKRDDFTQATKELLAKRVGYRCCNPDCGKRTIGPSSEEDKTVSIGVAAHIRAAALGGKRYDIRMSREERSSANNGIWLCQSCAKLIDSDAKKYTVQLLYQWKQWAEEQAEMELRCREVTHQASEDLEKLKFYLLCMDRPAFQDALRHEVRMHDPQLIKFHKAIGDTIIAINTGILRDREGDILQRGEGKVLMKNMQWRDKMGMITRILTDIRNTIEMRWIEDMKTVADPAFVDKLERDRQTVIDIMNSLCEDAGINGLEQW